MLEYCSNGTYPTPRNGYPGFQWFAYGIRNVGVKLKDIEQRGYIEFASIKESIPELTNPLLKDILSNHNLPVIGKKDVLVERVISNISEENLMDENVKRKYKLTNIGIQELEENAYIPYMHKHPHKTIEGSKFGVEFNIWSINKVMVSGDKSNWKDIVDLEE